MPLTSRRLCSSWRMRRLGSVPSTSGSDAIALLDRSSRLHAAAMTAFRYKAASDGLFCYSTMRGKGSIQEHLRLVRAARTCASSDVI